MNADNFLSRTIMISRLTLLDKICAVNLQHFHKRTRKVNPIFLSPTTKIVSIFYGNAVR